MSSLSDIFGYAQQVPNWAPNERFLPNADYGRVGALKLADNVFKQRIINYTYGTGNNQWTHAGKYHYYLLGKNMGKIANEKIRVQLTTAPTFQDFNFGGYDYEKERDGPFHFSNVLGDINEAARIYGFSTSVLVSAVLTIIHGMMAGNEFPTRILQMDGTLQEGATMARYNFGLLESLWGIRAGGYPKTLTARGVAARKEYKGRKNGGRSKRRRRY